MNPHKHIVILGSQWGDEGKGKVVDLLTARTHASAVVRFQGGHNAGHTLVIGGNKVKLSVIPSGIFHNHVTCFIGSGVVVAPSVLVSEIDMLCNQTAVPLTLQDIQQRLRISLACPIVLPSHIQLDLAREKALGRAAIGTTGRGIGPTYEDKIGRRGVRLCDLFHEARFKERVTQLLDYHNFLLTQYYQAAPVTLETVLAATLAHREALRPILTDVSYALEQVRKAGGVIIFEGAQGTGLDIDQGTYPFVTSSHTTAGAASTGSGVGPLHLDYVLGVTKAYTTRVGAGPMPTELLDTVGEYLRHRGQEFGTVTGRPRRCGWFDVAAMRRSVQINSLSGLCLTKLDVLDGLDEVKLCVGYRRKGSGGTGSDGTGSDGTGSSRTGSDSVTTDRQEILQVPPLDCEDHADVEPVYEVMPGWKDSTAGATDWGALPAAAKNYLARIETLLEVPIDILSTGPDRVETIIRE